MEDLGEEVWSAWDALCDRRGTFADIYSTASWLRSWASGAPAEEVSRARLVTVHDGGRLRAVLPVAEQRAGRWSTVGAFRYRTSLVADGEEPDADVVSGLAERLVALAPKELVLRRMPARDPATTLLVSALQEAGARVTTRETEHDNLAPVSDGWDGQLPVLEHVAPLPWPAAIPTEVGTRAAR